MNYQYSLHVVKCLQFFQRYYLKIGTDVKDCVKELAMSLAKPGFCNGVGFENDITFAHR